MELLMLGTGRAMVTRCYNTCFLLSENGSHLLVDGGGGNGILAQLRRTGVSPDEIHTIYVTHRHLDHILGILWISTAAPILAISLCTHTRNSWTPSAPL